MPRKVNEITRKRQLVETAHSYFDKGESKTNISHLMRVSSTQVMRFLREAVEKGVVKVEIVPPKLEGLERELKKRFPFLKNVIVVPTVKDYTFQQELWAKAAAEYFDESMKKGRIAISGGSTLFEMIAALPNRERDIDIYPTAIIGRGPTISHIDPLVNVTLLWAKSGRIQKRVHYTTVLPFEKKPSMQDIKDETKRFLKRKKIQAVYKEMREADAVFSSIGILGALPEDMNPDKFSYDEEAGSPTDARKHKELRASKVELLSEEPTIEKQLKKEPIVGEINYTFIDENGETKEDWKFFIALGVEDLRKMAADPKKQVIIIAGTHKERPLKAVLKGKLCNVLITDDVTARLLSKPSPE